MGMVVIKKYSNRRLYDTDQSRYITLDELAERVRVGTDVRVVDAKSNADLTQQTLAQIILESRGASKLLPAPLLSQLIRMQDEDLAEFFSAYMTWALELYLRTKQGVAQLTPFGPLTSMPSQLARLFGGFGFGGPPSAAPARPAPTPPPAEPAPPPVLPAASPEAASRGELDALRQELEDLKNALRAQVGTGGATGSSEKT